MMSLPMTCRSAGHQLRERSGSSGKPGAGDVVDQRVEPDVDDARLGVPRAVLALRGLAVLADRERDAPVAASSRLIEKSSRPCADEAEHLVAPVLRLDPVGVLLVVALAAAPGRPRGGRTSCARSATGAATSGWLGQCMPLAVSSRSLA